MRLRRIRWTHPGATRLVSFSGDYPYVYIGCVADVYVGHLRLGAPVVLLHREQVLDWLMKETICSMGDRK